MNLSSINIILLLSIKNNLINHYNYKSIKESIKLPIKFIKDIYCFKS